VFVFARRTLGRLAEESGDERSRRCVSATLVEEVVRNAAAAPPPVTVGAGFEPGWTDPAFYLAALITELRFVERTAFVVSDDQAGLGYCWRRRFPFSNELLGRPGSGTETIMAWVPDGYHLTWVPVWVPNSQTAPAMEAQCWMDCLEFVCLRLVIRPFTQEITGSNPVGGIAHALARVPVGSDRSIGRGDSPRREHAPTAKPECAANRAESACLRAFRFGAAGVCSEGAGLPAQCERDGLPAVRRGSTTPVAASSMPVRHSRLRVKVLVQTDDVDAGVGRR
jgi:hypothetical protein